MGENGEVPPSVRISSSREGEKGEINLQKELEEAKNLFIREVGRPEIPPGEKFGDDSLESVDFFVNLAKIARKIFFRLPLSDSLVRQFITRIATSYLRKKQSEWQLSQEILEEILGEINNILNPPSSSEIPNPPSLSEFPIDIKKLKSAWAIYALLNLRGSRDEIIERAARFSHFFICEREDITGTSFDEIVKQVFTGDNDRFPWSKDDQPREQKRLKDPRLEGIKFEETKTVTIDEITTDNEGNITGDGVKGAPLVIKIFSSDQSEEKLRGLLSGLLKNHPFVIIVEDTGGHLIFQIFANHEYLDGVPAAYYLKKIIEKGGYQITENIDEKTLGNYLFKLDNRENALSEIPEYSIKSIILSPDLTEKLSSLYESVEQIFNKNGLTLTFNDFIQLFIMYVNEVDDRAVRGGVLGFNFNIAKQLGHFSVGNVVGLFNHLAEKGEIDEDTLLSFGFSVIETDEGLRLNLYDPQKDNIQNMIAPLAKIRNILLWQILNSLSKKLRVLHYMAGQIMTSVIPDKIKGVEIGGLGGPALTEAQHGAYTIGFFNGSIVVRRKFKNEATQQIQNQPPSDL